MKRVIVSKISGGLGNQMFMYAAAKALSLRTNSSLLIDDSAYAKDLYGRSFELHHFNTKIRRANSLFSFKYVGGRLIRLLSNKLGRHIPLFFIRLVNEENFIFNSELVNNPSPNCYLNGYWQTDKYFKDFASVIQSEFQIKDPLSEMANTEANRILSYGKRAVALGVRRYQEVKKFVNVKVMERDYYIKAMRLMKIKVPDAKFFCFTQCPEWVEQNLSCLFDIEFIRPKNTESASIQDLQLFRLFDNFIISNSTYYWWGAWLSESGSKVVISPDNWCCSLTPCEDWLLI